MITSRTLWLASYPKSGNTWVRAQLDALVRNSEPDFQAMDADEAHDRMDPALGLTLGALSAAEAAAALRLSWALARPTRSGFVRRKTHSAWLPVEDGWPGPWQPPEARAIYIVRDPRAIVMSWAHHLGCTPEEAVVIMGDETRGLRAGHNADGTGVLSAWSRHVTSWLDDCTLPLLLVHYEDMLVDPIGQLTRIAEFAEIEATSEQILAAVEACSFSTLVTREIFEGFPEAAAPGRPFFRRGEAEAWRQELEPALVERVQSEHADVMSRLGYAIDA